MLQALGLQVLLRLDLQRNHIPAVLEDEVHLSGGILRRPVVGRSAQIGNELLADILLCERSLKLGEDGVALEQRLGVQIRHRRQQANIHQIQFEGRNVLICLQGNGALGHPADLAAQSAVDQPLDGQLKVLGPGPLPQDAVNEFLILLSELRGDSIPHHTDAGNDGRRSMLGKVLLIV